MSGYFTNGVPQATGPLTGLETIPVDTNLASGLAPESEAITTAQLAAYATQKAGANFRDFLDGGDFTINPWQRGTVFTGIANAVTYTADRWYGFGAATSSISISQQAIASSSLPGYNKALQFGRAAANTDVNPIYLGHVLETADVIRAQGQQMILSFYVLAGANFSGANGNLSVNVYSTVGGAANQSAAALQAGTWTAQASAIAQGSAQLVLPTTSWQRFFALVNVPVGATQLGVNISYTPTGIAGANDWVQFADFDLAIVGASGFIPSSVSQLTLSQFAPAPERRDVQVELEICQRYCFVINEPAANVVVGAGMNNTAAIQTIFVPFPTQMIKAPTVTFSGTPTWKTNQANTATASTITAGTTHTQNAMSLLGNSAGVAGQATLLQGGGGTGVIIASADF